MEAQECWHKKRRSDSFSKCFDLKLYNSMERVRVLNVKGGMCCFCFTEPIEAQWPAAPEILRRLPAFIADEYRLCQVYGPLYQRKTQR